MAADVVVEFEPGLWWVAVTSTLAAVAITVGALRGLRAHRWPRIFLASSVWFIAFSYWIEVFNDVGVGADMRRGGGFLLWPSLFATAMTGVLFSRKAVKAQQLMIEKAGSVGDD